MTAFGDEYATPETARTLRQIAAQLQRLDDRVSTLADGLQRMSRELRAQREAALWQQDQQQRGYANRDRFNRE